MISMSLLDPRLSWEELRENSRTHQEPSEEQRRDAVLAFTEFESTFQNNFNENVARNLA